ncbi:hypothetical protein N9090_00260, partial [bacterium]|nr:hypothetical protein [bacterium]
MLVENQLSEVGLDISGIVVVILNLEPVAIEISIGLLLGVKHFEQLGLPEIERNLWILVESPEGGAKVWAFEMKWVKFHQFKREIEGLHFSSRNLGQNEKVASFVDRALAKFGG